MTTATVTRSDEYSKLWVKNNPELFAKYMLDFMAKHPEASFTIEQTSGFFTIKAPAQEVSA